MTDDRSEHFKAAMASLDEPDEVVNDVMRNIASNRPYDPRADEMSQFIANEQRLDRLAAMAMQGLVATGAVIVTTTKEPQAIAAVVRRAYDIAEAMIAEGKRRGGK